MKAILLVFTLFAAPAFADGIYAEDAYYSHEASAMREQNQRIAADNQREEASRQAFQEQIASRPSYMPEPSYVPYSGSAYPGGAPGNPVGSQTLGGGY